MAIQLLITFEDGRFSQKSVWENYAAEKDWKKAIYYYDKLVNIDPENSDYLYRLGGTQAAYSEVVNKFRVLSIINSAKKS